MQLTNNIEIVDLALWLKEEKVLVISDLHLGYEEMMKWKGFLVPKFQFKDIFNRLKKILDQTKPKKMKNSASSSIGKNTKQGGLSKIIINGDLKNEFGGILKQEWSDILKLIDFLLKNCEELVIIKGNHDVTLGPVALKRGIRIVDDYLIKDYFFTHGDKIKETSAKTIIIGHEHPAITLREKSKAEKYKCFLKGKYKDKNLIVIPSFNPLTEGTDILAEKRFSPYLENILAFEVFAVGDEVYNFGKLRYFNR